MEFNRNDAVEIQSNEYIVINKSTNDGREYLFVADKLHPDVNLIDNFNEDALKLLLLSREEGSNSNTYKVEKNQEIIQKIVVNMYA